MIDYRFFLKKSDFILNILQEEEYIVNEAEEEQFASIHCWLYGKFASLAFCIYPSNMPCKIYGLLY